jgi:hypothetical protein
MSSFQEKGEKRPPPGGRHYLSRHRCTGYSLAAALVACALLCASAYPVPRHPILRDAYSFAFAIGSGALQRDLGRYDLVVVDGQEASRARVAALRRAGARVLAYLSVGTIEPGRPWYARAKPYRLDLYAEFGEFYADTRRAPYRRLIAGVVAPAMLAKGFDGLFLDNTDMVETHPAQSAGMRALVAALARLVHRNGRVLFTQNGEATIGPTLRLYDGWNREDVTWTYDFVHRRYLRVPARARRAAQTALRRFAAAGLLVTATDYVRAGDAAATAEAVANACAAGALPFVSDIGLRRIPRAPPACPS